MTAIIMVHGAFGGGWVFETWRGAFEAAGYDVLTPDLRGHAAGEPPDRLTGVSMADYARDIAELCTAQAEPPVLLGHSMGGLVTQLAARQAALKALVLIAPSGPWGVAGASMEEAITAFGVGALTPFAGYVEPDPTIMRTYSLDRASETETQRILQRMTPESARALRETLNWWLDPFMTTSVGAGPLPVRGLVLSGEDDKVHTPATVRRTAERIGAEFRLLPKTSHWPFVEPSRDAVAKLVLDWLAAEARAAA